MYCFARAFVVSDLPSYSPVHKANVLTVYVYVTPNSKTVQKKNKKLVTQDVEFVSGFKTRLEVVGSLSGFVCLGFYAVSTVFQLFNGDSSRIYVSWTPLNQY